MSDFGHLKNLEPVRSAEYTVSEIIGQPVLTMVFAGQSNPGYFNAMLKKRSMSPAEARRQMNSLSVKDLDKEREIDYELYPQFVIKSWANVTNTGGHAVPFSKSKCEEFLRALPKWLFDNIRNFAKDPLSFSKGFSEEEEATLVGNSQPVSSGSSRTEETDGS